jgi:hypothetical protein
VSRLRRTLAAAAALTCALVTVRPAVAYDADFTHRWITRQAIEHLRAAYPGEYDDVLDHLEALLDGVTDEDNELLDGDADVGTLRVMRHFLRPTDGAGFSYQGREFPSSFEWGAIPDASNAWGYDDAVAYWKAGDKANAYTAIGHVIHLIQDATVPAHTHLDNHGPPAGDTYEDYCSSRMRSDRDGDLATPPAGAAIPEFETLEDLFYATARASYYRNLVPGALTGTDTNDAVATGALGAMFPDADIDWLSHAWEIPGVGTLDVAFWEQEPGRFYFKRTDGVGATARAGFDATAPDAFAFAANPDAEALHVGMARDLVPIAILHSASLLKKFMDHTRDLEVDRPEPDPDPTAASADGGGCAAGGTGGPGTALVVLLASSTLFVRRPRRRGVR